MIVHGLFRKPVFHFSGSCTGESLDPTEKAARLDFLATVWCVVAVADHVLGGLADRYAR
jgi:hypothetical protein